MTPERETELQKIADYYAGYEAANVMDECLAALKLVRAERDQLKARCETLTKALQAMADEMAILAATHEVPSIDEPALIRALVALSPNGDSGKVGT